MDHALNSHHVEYDTISISNTEQSEQTTPFYLHALKIVGDGRAFSKSVLSIYEAEKLIRSHFL